MKDQINAIRRAVEMATPHYQADTERFKQALAALDELERTYTSVTAMREPVAMLWKVRKALALASAICDRVPNRWHHTHEIGSAEADIGDMVNAHPDGAHGYRLIQESEAELVAYLTTPEAAPPAQQAQPSESLESLLSTAIGILMGYSEKYSRGYYKPGSVIDKFVNECVERLRDWPGSDDSVKHAQPSEELAEADRRAGAAERELAACKDDLARLNRVRDEMKKQWGVDRYTSFDVVWAEALALKQAQVEAVPSDVVRDVEAAAKKMAEIFDYPWDFMPEKGRSTMRENVRAILAAAQGEKP